MDDAGRRAGRLGAVVLALCVIGAGCTAGGGGASPSGTTAAGSDGSTAPASGAPSASPGGPAGPGSGSPTSASPAGPGTTSVPGIAGVPMELRIKVIADAAARTGAPPGSFVFVKADAVTWPNGALGCPTPGQAYTEALVPGWWLVVVVGGVTRLDYRVTQAGAVTRCDRPGPG